MENGCNSLPLTFFLFLLPVLQNFSPVFTGESHDIQSLLVVVVVIVFPSDSNGQLLNIYRYAYLLLCLPGDSDGKDSAYNVGNPGLIFELGRFPGEGSGNLLQYSCLGNSTGMFQSVSHIESDKTERLTHVHFHFLQK